MEDEKRNNVFIDPGPFPLTFAASSESASVIQTNDNGDDPRESKNAFGGPAAKATLRSTGK